MHKKLSVTLLFVVLLIPSAARAHDPSKHKGKGVQGEIVSIANDRIELKTSASAQTVTINDKTKFERGSAQVTKSDLKKGDRVTVFGTKLANGELVAREILLGGPEHAQGEIASIANDRIELKTSAGAMTVTISDTTKFERGSAQVMKSDLKKGDRVTVFGTKMANGELLARGIRLGSPEHHESQKEKAAHKH